MRIGVRELAGMLGAIIKGSHDAKEIVRVITDTRNLGIESGAVLRPYPARIMTVIILFLKLFPKGSGFLSVSMKWSLRRKNKLLF
jgi:hypothetical protein